MTQINPPARILEAATLTQTASLTPNPRNSRLHSDAQISQIVASIKEFGFTMPILADEAGMVLAGHARLQAALILELEQVPVIRATDWTEAQKRAYVIADNKLALNADWADDVLKAELKALVSLDIDPTMSGFAFDEIGGMTMTDPIVETPAEQTKTQTSHIVHNCPNCGHEFR